MKTLIGTPYRTGKTEEEKEATSVLVSQRQGKTQAMIDAAYARGWTAGASAQRESDAIALWRVLVSGKGNSFETVKFNELVTLPKGEA